MINPPKEKQETVMMKHRENGMRVTLQRIQFQMLRYYYLFQDLITSHRFSGKIMICVKPLRSEEHTSELQSRFDLVCRLLLEKKNNYKKILNTITKYSS